ncbi:MAG: YeeE/YedE family protein [Myxococcales bacterium FL481]|nr:MAG: YeeE/YedE family protein [Myxococcales bacterium FL481]
MRWLVAFISGVGFAVGLAVGGMLDPHRVLGFLDVLGRWDPTLAFVMAGAWAVNAIAYRVTMRRSLPRFGAAFALPPSRGVDRRLLVGSALFGVGWALSGYCPGPALTNLATGSWTAIGFVVAMAAGMSVGQLSRPR